MADLKTLIEAIEHAELNGVKAVVQDHPEFVNQRDEHGATPLHYASLGGHRAIVEFLVQHGAQINATDSEFGATPAGWGIEYMREMGAFLGIELSDMAFAIERRDIDWIQRFLKRFPGLRQASDTHGRSFKQLAYDSGNPEIVQLFDLQSDP